MQRVPKNNELRVFEGKVVVFDLTGVPIKQKKDIQSILETQGANIILVLTRKVLFIQVVSLSIKQQC